MPTTDIFQRNRKLKKPQIRRHSDKGGEWGFDTSHGSKARLSLLADLTKQARQDGSLRQEKDYVTGVNGNSRVHWNVAYQGKEYAPDEFVEKFPSFRCEYTWEGRGKAPKCATDKKKSKKKTFSVFGEGI